MTFLLREFDTALRKKGHVEKGLSDSDLLDLVQSQTLRYFLDYAHPVSGMARERSNYSPAYNHMETVTTGGTGFGIMALVAGANRGLVDRQRAIDHIEKIVDFLKSAPAYHGVFPHFMDGATGSTIPFSQYDDGADLVETSFLMMGLLTARSYFKESAPALKEKISDLWEAVNWRWHIPDNRSDLLWHWSAANDFTQDLSIKGWNECLVTQILAASSPTHTVDPDIYHASWARGVEFFNGKRYNGIELPLGPEKGGPLFFSHYSFLGLDPRGLQDDYADYWQQNVNHTQINRAHCLENPFGYEGYGERCWGLTASDAISGYAAHTPDYDTGIIAPTAALSSFAYTPDYSMQALRHFYEDRGDKLWGEYGFYDSFQPESAWVSSGHIAIDQGPIICMIENYRSGLLWDVFMNIDEVRTGLKALGFKSPHLSRDSAAYIPV